MPTLFLAYRRMIWEGHVELVAKHNREFDMGVHTYTLGINEYADMVSTQILDDRVNLTTIAFIL